MLASSFDAAVPVADDSDEAVHEPEFLMIAGLLEELRAQRPVALPIFAVDKDVPMSELMSYELDRRPISFEVKPAFILKRLLQVARSWISKRIPECVDAQLVIIDPVGEAAAISEPSRATFFELVERFDSESLLCFPARV